MTDLTDLQKWEEILKRNGWFLKMWIGHPEYTGRWHNPDHKPEEPPPLTLDNLFGIGVRGLEVKYPTLNIHFYTRSDGEYLCHLDQLGLISSGTGVTRNQALLEALHKELGE